MHSSALEGIVWFAVGNARVKKSYPLNKTPTFSADPERQKLMQFVLIPVQKHPVQAPHEGSGTSSRTSHKERK